MEENLHETWIKSLKVLAFDVDGTLYESPRLSEEIDRVKIARVAKHLKCTLEEAVQQFQKLYQKLRSNTKVLDHLGIDGQQFFIDVWNNIDLRQFILPNPALVRAVTEEKRFTYAILTNSNTKKQVKTKLNLIGFAPVCFSYILTSTDIGVNKPDPQAFLALIQAVGVRPEEILYAGDREDVDITPAKALGIRTAIVRRKSEHADIVVDSPEELFEMLLSHAR